MRYLFYDFILIFVENCLKFNTIHDFSVWQRPDINPADINRFLSQTGNETLVANFIPIL